MTAEWAKYRLVFNFEARTSRQVMTCKDTYFVRIRRDGGGYGYGECALFAGLSAEDNPAYETALARACSRPGVHTGISSIDFGLETAMAAAGYRDAPVSPFDGGGLGIVTNGLIWMGDRETMRRRIDEKLAQGFNVLKLKIGGIDFESELDLLRYVRSRYSAGELELRLDANGSFANEDALRRLEELAPLAIHSIEQPVKAGQPEVMAAICRRSPVAVALDEELIGSPTEEDFGLILDDIAPQYIILKPSLCGGFAAADRWIAEAERRNVGWWATSALESNIGLHAIASWVGAHGVCLPQGLGTGLIYSNNIPSGLYMRGNSLYFDGSKPFKMPELTWRQCTL